MLRSFLAACIAASLVLLCPLNLRAQSGPWAHSSPQLKGEALVRDADGGDLREMRLIVQGGGDVNWQLSPTGLTPLMAAASADHLEVVQFLIEHGADPSMRDSNGFTALERAQRYGANDVVRYLERLGASAEPVPPPVPAPAPAAQARGPVRATGAAMRNGRPISASPHDWPAFGSFRAGDTVRFHLSTGWRRGLVREVGTDAARRGSVTCGAKKYLVESLEISNATDCIDWGSVVALDRQPYWTAFFAGDWALGETMAANSRVAGGDVWTEYSHMGATEALRVNANGTYVWKNRRGVVAQGQWAADPDGPGIILRRGPRRLDWTLTNETNAIAEGIRGIESARLTARGQMSVAAKRPITARR
ncbi:MAG: ankyrin repeat domain-containing protein [Gemmatimonadaceae bacterium]|nr:ankyrin repeat domain-containing protein [Gemmatimonadaceae bacterium]NUQ92717.1 ankyrin repeat domain-containing protein [Gemmatimonadaceae bacterium]